MKKLFVIAALLMATTAAHAGNSVSFEIGGHKIHIEAPKDCSTLSCLKVSSPDGTGFDFKGFKSKHSDDDNNVADRSDSPQNAATAPAQAAAPQPTAPAATATAPASTVASTDTIPGVGFETPSAASRAPAAPAPATIAPAAPVAAAPVAAPGTPIGLWATEENKGNVRVEQCGQDLCGFTDKTNEKILINMKPSDSKWVGRIHDPNSGRTYDSTIAMKGPNAMRVQGCAFGGMFCGGQTWKRVS